jgi:uncharacterized protein YkwD
VVFRHAIVVIGAVVLAAVGAVSVAEPEETEAMSAVKACGGGKIKLNAREERILHLHNRARKSREVRPLCVHPALTRAARAHSSDMIRRDYFSHNTKGKGESACERIRRYGYRWRACAENIAWGAGSRGSPAKVFKGWMDGRVHRSHILAKKFREVGIGSATGSYKGTDGVTMYTVDFGTRR